MNTRIILTLGLLAALQSAPGQEPAVPAPAAVPVPEAIQPPPPTPPAPVPEKIVRDPFWPVGYSPLRPGVISSSTNSSAIQRDSTAQQPGTNTVPQEIIIHWPDLKVKGLTKQANGTYLAIIEGVGIVEEGQVLILKSQGHIFRIKVKGITEKGILQQRLDYKPVHK